ncbi:MAG: class I SAM-dependent methyltransferase [bacterium]
MKSEILITKPQPEYELIDSGEGEKLERYGEVLLRRPDPQALWNKKLSKEAWDKADGRFVRPEGQKGGIWKMSKNVPEEWQINLGSLKFWIKPTSFKHTGVFPEQLPNWQKMNDVIKKKVASGKKDIQVLNLFGYTGGATLACAKAGAAVTHVDASKSAVTWANENAELSGLKNLPVRWILEDALSFVKKEVKRGKKYDGIIMDPPAFGRGTKGEVWKIEDDLLPLLKVCFELLSDDSSFFLINGYASGYSATAYHNNLEEIVEKYGGKIESGELAIEEKTDSSEGYGRLLPCGIFARWTKV